MGFGLGYRRGSLAVDLGGAIGGTSSRLEGPDAGIEDTWTADLGVAWVRPVAEWDRTTIRVGGSLAGLAFVRRHHYGRDAAREYYVDLMVPLSLVGDAVHRVANDAAVEEHLELGLGAVLFRSPFAATKTFPSASLVGPGSLTVVRNRMTLEWRTSSRTRLTLSHALTFYDTDRNRLVRVLQQRVGVGIARVLGVSR